MTQFETLVDLLNKRVNKVNMNNPKSNRAGVIMKGYIGYQDRMSIWVSQAVDLLTRRLAYSKVGDSVVGQCKLTAISNMMGKKVVQDITGERDPADYITLNVGDYILGALFTLDFIDIYRQADEESEYSENQAPYIVEVTDKFYELTETIPPELQVLNGTSQTKIENISGLIQTNGNSILKYPHEDQEAAALMSIRDGDEWVKAADLLQQTGWKINQEVTDVILREFNNLLPVIPVRPSVGSKAKVNTALEKLKKDDTQANRNAYNKACAEWNIMLDYLSACSKKAERISFKKKLEVLREYPEFYHYVDFDSRGRIYYQETLLNFQGSDWARGVMLFSEGKQLNEVGLRWLAIHTANSYNCKFNVNNIPEYFTYDYKTYLEENDLQDISLDKMTLVDRQAWTLNNMDWIVSQADTINDCEKEISFLACCIEWKNYLADPENHVSYMPIPIDGSNNGYQHSGAIAQDELTGSYVGLAPTELPKDLYMVCAKELMKRCPDFFDKRGMSMSQIRKAIAKRGVMTRAYSAGAATIAENMYADCHKEGYAKKFNITMLDCEYLAKELYNLIKDICPGATKTMEFLQKLVMFELGEFGYFEISTGKKVSKNKRKKLMAARKKLMKLRAEDITPEELQELNDIQIQLDDIETRCIHGNGTNVVTWETPVGFLAVSDYKIMQKDKILSTIVGYTGGATKQPGRIKHVLQTETSCPDKSKQQSAISPNFIHSLDSAHLLGTVLAWGGQFGAVHDSFSVHANDVDTLSDLTKSTFVEMYDHEDPYVEIANLITTDAEDFDVELPTYGSLDINGVMESEYFFC